MAANRTIATSMWAEDEWFQDLPPLHKLVFMYCFTSPLTTACGTLGASPKTVSDATGIPRPEVKQILADLAPKVVYWPEYQVIWVRNFLRRQDNGGTFRVAAYKSLVKERPEVAGVIMLEYPEIAVSPKTLSAHEENKAYPTDTLPIPYNNPIDRVATDTEGSRGQESGVRNQGSGIRDQGSEKSERNTARVGGVEPIAKSPKKQPRYQPSAFKAFEEAYPARDRADAIAAWDSTRPPADDIEAMMLTLAPFRGSPLSDEEKSHIQGPGVFLRKRHWERDPPFKGLEIHRNGHRNGNRNGNIAATEEDERKRQARANGW